MKDYLFQLRTTAWRTAAARYNAVRRLKRREFVSTVSLAFFSALTVALAFVQRIYSLHPGSEIDNYLTALSACLGIFLLAISLIEWGAANGAKADALHRNAESLNAFSRELGQVIAELDSGEATPWSRVDQLRRQYEAIKEGCAHNHDPLDDSFFLAEQRMSKEFLANGKPKISWFEAKWIKARYWWSSLSSFAIYWIVVVTLIVATPWATR
jgi:hypothetical protein